MSNASVVFPTRFWPVTRYEWASLSSASARSSDLIALSCPVVRHMVAYAYLSASAG